MEYVIAVSTIFITIIINVFYHTVIFANKFGKIEEKLEVLDHHKSEIDLLDRRVIKTTLENLDKEMTNMRTENNMLLRDFRDEHKVSIRELKNDSKNDINRLQKSVDRVLDKMDK